MRKTLMIFGGIFCVLLIVVIGLTVYSFSVGPRLDKESKVWVDEIIPQIVSVWDVQKLVENSSPEFLQVTSEENVRTLFTKLSTELGPLTQYKGSHGEAGIHFNNMTKTITAEYTVEGDFEKGSARVYILGKKTNGTWKIMGFHVNIRSAQ